MNNFSAALRSGKEKRAMRRCVSEPVVVGQNDADSFSPPTVEKARKGYEEGNIDFSGMAGDTDCYTGECCLS